MEKNHRVSIDECVSEGKTRFHAICLAYHYGLSESAVAQAWDKKEEELRRALEAKENEGDETTMHKAIATVVFGIDVVLLVVLADLLAAYF